MSCYALSAPQTVKGAQAERGSGTRPHRGVGTQRRSPFRVSRLHRSLEKPLPNPAPLICGRVSSGPGCLAGAGVLCGEGMRHRALPAGLGVSLPKGQKRTAAICLPALPSLYALGERQIRPTLTARRSPPAPSAPLPPGPLPARVRELTARHLRRGYRVSCRSRARLAVWPPLLSPLVLPQRAGALSSELGGGLAGLGFRGAGIQPSTAGRIA